MQIAHLPTIIVCRLLGRLKNNDGQNCVPLAFRENAFFKSELLAFALAGITHQPRHDTTELLQSIGNHCCVVGTARSQGCVSSTGFPCCSFEFYCWMDETARHLLCDWSEVGVASRIFTCDILFRCDVRCRHGLYVVRTFG